MAMKSQHTDDRFRLLVSSVKKYAIFMLDTSGLIISWNIGAQEMIGYAPDEIIGQHFSCLYPPGDIHTGKPQQELQMAAVAGQCEDEGWRVHQSGYQFWASVLITALVDESGHLLGFSVISRELTERRRIEEELCEANRALKMISECNKALVRTTEEGQLLHDICQILVKVGGYRWAWVAYTNTHNRVEISAESAGTLPQMTQVYGCYLPNPHAPFSLAYHSPSQDTVTESEDETDLQTTYPHSPLVIPHYPATRVMQTGQPVIVNDLLRDKEFSSWRGEAVKYGYTACISLPLRQYELDNGSSSTPLAQSLPRVFGVLNIYAVEPNSFNTKEKHLLGKLADDLAYGIMARCSRRERKQAERALRESEQQLRAIFEGALEAMVITDDAGCYLDVNQAACDLFNLPKEQLIGLNVADFCEATFVFDKAWSNFMGTGPERGEFRLRRADGTIRDVEYSARAGFLPNRHLSVIRDITDRKRTEEELRQYRNHLEERVAERTKAEKRLIVSLQSTNQQLQQEIRERQRVEEVLRDLVETFHGTSLQLRTLINAMPDIVCFKDGAGRWLEANQAMLQLFELDQVDYRGKTDAQLAALSHFYRDSLFHCLRTDQDAWSQETLCHTEEMIPRSNGYVKIYDVIKVPLFHSDGQRKGLVVLGRDITQRKQAEEALIRLASIVESSDDAIIGKTVDGEILSWNTGAERIYGYNATEVKGQRVSLLSMPDRPNEMPRILASIVAGGSIEHYETVHVRKDGKYIDVSLTISPIKNATGQIVGVSTIARDISDRKRVEKALEQLRHQNELILNSAGEGICGLNRQGIITFINPAAARMTGYTLRDLIDQPLTQTLLNSQSGTDENISSPILTTLQDGTPCHITDDRFWRANGTYFPVEYVSTPIIEQDEIIGAVVTFKDITERQAVEKMKDEFISVVSHELRTPLASIHGALGLLASGVLQKQPQRAERMLEIAIANTDRLVRLISDILDLERMHSGQITMHKQPCNVAALITQAADEMRGLAEKHQIQFIVDSTETDVCVDADRIIQTLTNLISNAIKFSREGATVWLRGSIETPGTPALGGSSPYVLIQVKDEGRGIPADKLESIFGRFQQVDASDSRQKGGTGLGLAICRSIIQQHGGRIWVESTLGQGSSFYFTLPLLCPSNAIEPAHFL